MGGGAGVTLGRLAEVLGATLDAHPERIVTGVAELARATPSEVAYIADRRHLEAARVSRAGAFLAPRDIGALPAPTLTCRDPRMAFAEVLALFHPPTRPAPGVDPSARVAADARVDPTASVGAFTVVESGASIGAGARIAPLSYVGPAVEIGADSVLFPRVVIYAGCRLGQRVVVHAGTVIGADGFGFVPGKDGHRKIPQVGTVIVEDDVEIGANVTVDRATLGETVIRRGAKIDNLVHVGHNVEVGAGCLIAAQTGIAGSSSLGAGVMLGGQVGIADHVTVGAGAIMGAQAGTTRDIGAGERVTGTWARPMVEAMRIWQAQEQLPQLLRTVKDVQARLGALEALVAGEKRRT